LPLIGKRLEKEREDITLSMVKGKGKEREVTYNLNKEKEKEVIYNENKEKEKEREVVGATMTMMTGSGVTIPMVEEAAKEWDPIRVVVVAREREEDIITSTTTPWEEAKEKAAVRVEVKEKAAAVEIFAEILIKFVRDLNCNMIEIDFLQMSN
jgi:hypothetical protein